MAAGMFGGPGGSGGPGELRQALHGHVTGPRAASAPAPLLALPAVHDATPVTAGGPPGTGTGPLCRQPLPSAGESKVLASRGGWCWACSVSKSGNAPFRAVECTRGPPTDGAVLPSGTSGTIWAISDRHSWARGGLATGGQRPGTQHTGRPPTAENCSAPNVDGARDDKSRPNLLNPRPPDGQACGAQFSAATNAAAETALVPPAPAARERSRWRVSCGAPRAKRKTMGPSACAGDTSAGAGGRSPSGQSAEEASCLLGTGMDGASRSCSKSVPDPPLHPGSLHPLLWAPGSPRPPPTQAVPPAPRR